MLIISFIIVIPSLSLIVCWIFTSDYLKYSLPLLYSCTSVIFECITLIYIHDILYTLYYMTFENCQSFLMRFFILYEMHLLKNNYNMELIVVTFYALEVWLFKLRFYVRKYIYYIEIYIYFKVYIFNLVWGPMSHAVLRLHFILYLSDVSLNSHILF